MGKSCKTKLSENWLKYNVRYYFCQFLAELLLCYLTGNILGLKSCRRCTDDMQMTCRQCADDKRMRLRVKFHWRMTNVIHMSSAQQLCIKPTGFLVGVELDIKTERKMSLECARMHDWALKPKSFQGQNERKRVSRMWENVYIYIYLSIKNSKNFHNP